MKNNKGMTLVEIIIVVAILSIISAAGVIGVGMITGRPAQECAIKLKSTISSNRTSALGKKSCDLTISSDGTYVYAVETINGTAGNSQVIGTKNVKAEYSLDGGASYTDLTGGSVTFSFDRSDGSLKGMDSDIVFRITKNTTVYQVRIYHLTGKVEAEKQ